MDDERTAAPGCWHSAPRAVADAKEVPSSAWWTAASRHHRRAADAVDRLLAWRLHRVVLPGRAARLLIHPDDPDHGELGTRPGRAHRRQRPRAVDRGRSSRRWSSAPARGRRRRSHAGHAQRDDDRRWRAELTCARAAGFGQPLRGWTPELHIISVSCATPGRQDLHSLLVAKPAGLHDPGRDAAGFGAARRRGAAVDARVRSAEGQPGIDCRSGRRHSRGRTGGVDARRRRRHQAGLKPRGRLPGTRGEVITRVSARCPTWVCAAPATVRGRIARGSWHPGLQARPWTSMFRAFRAGAHSPICQASGRSMPW